MTSDFNNIVSHQSTHALYMYNKLFTLPDIPAQLCIYNTDVL